MVILQCLYTSYSRKTNNLFLCKKQNPMRLHTILLALLFPMIVCAQKANVQRYEFQENNNEYVQCIPFGTDGFLLHSQFDEKQTVKKQTVFTFTKYDTTCTKLNSADIIVPSRKSAYLDYRNNENYYFLSYQTSGTYSVSIVSAKTLTTSTIQGKFPKNTIIQAFRAVGDYVYILGKTKELPMLLIQNTKTNEISFGKIIPLTKRNFSIMSFEINEETNEVYIFTKDALKNDRLVKMYIYKDGAKIHESLLKSTQADKYIVSASASRLEDGSCLISGTYGNTAKNNDISVGLFITKKNLDGSIAFTKYINYLDINNFTSYLPDKRQEKIEKKQERRTAQDKKLELNYLMTPHKIIEQNGEFILVGESYYPTYREECEYQPSPNGQMEMFCFPVFDGYQYTHFFALAFNEKGDLLWSNAAPMDIDYKPYSVVHFLAINSKQDYIQTMYSSWDKIFINIFHANGTNTNQEISFVDDSEKMLHSTSRNRYWYDNVFISYGNQGIKDKEEHEKRQFFYFEKVTIPHE